jgi:hypothetical protein
VHQTKVRPSIGFASKRPARKCQDPAAIRAQNQLSETKGAIHSASLLEHADRLNKKGPNRSREFSAAKFPKTTPRPRKRAKKVVAERA